MIIKKEAWEVAAHLKELGITEQEVVDKFRAREVLDTAVVHSTLKVEGNDIKYSFIIKKLGQEEFGTNGYRVSYTDLPALKHQVIDGIDTEALEQKMSNINWFGIHPVELFLNDKIATVMSDLYNLSRMASGKDTADLLMFKFWNETPMDDLIVNKSKFNHLEKHLIIPLDNHIEEINGIQAYNLINGRGVLKYFEVEGLSIPKWLVAENGTIKALDDYELSGHITQITFKPPFKYGDAIELGLKLQNGERVAAELVFNNKTVKVYLEADPRNKTLIVRGEDSQVIDLKVLVNKKPSPTQTPQTKKNNKRRGKGL